MSLGSSPSSCAMARLLVNEQAEYNVIGEQSQGTIRLKVLAATCSILAGVAVAAVVSQRSGTRVNAFEVESKVTRDFSALSPFLHAVLAHNATAHDLLHSSWAHGVSTLKTWNLRSAVEADPFCNYQNTVRMAEGVYCGPLVNGTRDTSSFPGVYGKMWYSNGDRFQGEWRKSRRNGLGISFYHKGDKYVGEFREDQQSGWGISFFHNGDKYVGHWLKGEFNGLGTNDYHNGDKYVGEWLNGNFSGHGTSAYHTGNSYVGEWLHGLPNGAGVWSYAGGVSSKGTWKDGKPVTVMNVQT